MAYRKCGALVASIGVAALTLVFSTDSFARPAGAPRAAFAAPHPAFRHHHRGPGGYWAATDGYYYGPTGEPVTDAAPPVSSDVHYSYTNDVPWDWAHRYPPNVVPSDRPYVSGCPTEHVVVPGRGGDKTISITRCY